MLQDKSPAESSLALKINWTDHIHKVPVVPPVFIIVVVVVPVNLSVV